MQKTDRKLESNGKEIKIPYEYVEKIDKIIGTNGSLYPSREEFIKSAVMKKMAELKGLNQM